MVPMFGRGFDSRQLHKLRNQQQSKGCKFTDLQPFLFLQTPKYIKQNQKIGEHEGEQIQA